jgi:hypothetical protein
VGVDDLVELAWNELISVLVLDAASHEGGDVRPRRGVEVPVAERGEGFGVRLLEVGDGSGHVAGVRVLILEQGLEPDE